MLRDVAPNLKLKYRETVMPKLNQIIAIEKGIKNESNVAITAAYHELQKSALFTGIARVYEPKDEEGERFPPEHQKVQKRAEDLLHFTADTMTKYWDVTATKDIANTEARADVVVDGKKVLDKVPVTFLLFLEKQLGDLATMVKKLPVLDAGETWKHDSSQNCHATEAASTIKTKKIPRAFVKAEATKEHPAQVDTFTEDVVVGSWKTIKYSGALPQRRVTEVLERIGKLQSAVKFAREEANTIQVTDKHVGKDVFAFILG
jgi:hypothetical protein